MLIFRNLTLSGQLLRISGWFRDDTFRRLFFNAGKLLGGNSIATGIALVSTLLTARALGPQNYGILTLVLVYELTIGKLLTFNVWQAFIKFGGEALHIGNHEDLRQLIKLCFCLDISSATAGTILAILLSGPTIKVLGWNQDIRSLLVLYSLLVIFSINGTPIGVLRLFNRFDLLSINAALSSLIRFIGVVICLLLKQNLYGFVVVYLITGILGQLYLLISSIWVLYNKGIHGYVFQSLVNIQKRFPGIWNYVWTTNINSTLAMILREGSTLLIAGLTGPSALGLYKIAQQITQTILKLSDPLNHAIYPELSKLFALKRINEFFSLIKRSAVIVTTISLSIWFGFVVLGEKVIIYVLGHIYLGAYPIAVVYILAAVVAMSGFSFQSAMLAIGWPHRSTIILLIGTVVYYFSLFILVQYIGIIGAAYAYLVYCSIWLILMFMNLRSYFIYYTSEYHLQ